MFKQIVLALVLFMNVAHCAEKTPQILHLNIAGEPDSLDPRVSNNINASFVINTLFQGLTEVNSDGSVSYALIDSVNISEDRKIYSFHLKKTKWSDGKPVTADDFEFAWKSCLDPKKAVPCANLLYPIKNAEAAKRGEVPLEKVGVKAKDTHTLVVELEQPVPFFLDLMAATIFFPVPKHQVEKDPLWGSRADIVVNGPFKIAQWEHNREISIVRNPQYWDADSVKIDRMTIGMVSHEPTALQMYTTEKLDFIGGDYSPIPLDSIPSLKKKGNLQKADYGGTRYCALNINEFPFNNLNIRKAFSIAVNRQRLIDNITFCDDEPATGMICSVFKNNKRSDLFPDGDAALAKKHLELGLKELNIKPEDLNITLKYENSEITNRIAQTMQQQWQDALGVKVKLEAGELKTFVDSLRRRNFQIGLIYWMLHYNSPMDIMDRYRSKDLLKNYPGWENQEYTQLLDHYFTEGNADKQREILNRAEAIFMADMPVIPLFHFSRPFLCKNELKGVQVTPIGDIFFNRAYLEASSE
jgi:oligopeptide transport system substrate-binding protein